MSSKAEQPVSTDCSISSLKEIIFKALKEGTLTQIDALYINEKTGEKIPGYISIGYTGDILAFTRGDNRVTTPIKPSAFLNTSFYSLKPTALGDSSIFIDAETVHKLQLVKSESGFKPVDPLQIILRGRVTESESELIVDGEIMTDFATMVLTYMNENKASHILCEKRREGIYFHILASYKEWPMNESKREKMQKFFLENAGKNKNLTIGGAEDTVIIWNYALARDEFKNPHVIETLKKIIEKIHKAGDNYGLVSRVSTIERVAIAELADVFSTDYPLFNEIECQIITFAHGFEREYISPTVGSNMVCSNSDRVGVTRLTLSIRIPPK